uniref:Uncharacterized protein n=1 Tax=Knipowitschia caucasica TaxID=637954 RepID=A0AAV2LS04_KNICA
MFSRSTCWFLDHGRSEQRVKCYLTHHSVCMGLPFIPETVTCTKQNPCHHTTSSEPGALSSPAWIPN